MNGQTEPEIADILAKSIAENLGEGKLIPFSDAAG